MNKKMMCPMMCPMMMGPTGMGMEMEPMNVEDMYEDDDEKDENYFADMYPDSCTKIMPYVVETLDKAEHKDEMMYESYPGKDMVKGMVDSTYDKMVSDMPDMADEEEEERQYGRRRFARDLVGVLLLNELLRRRRRRRRPYGHFENFGYNYPEYNDYDYYDYY